MRSRNHRAIAPPGALEFPLRRAWASRLASILEDRPDAVAALLDLHESLAEEDGDAFSFRLLAEDPSDRAPGDQHRRGSEELFVPAPVEPADLDSRFVVEDEAARAVTHPPNLLLHTEFAEDVHAVRRDVEEGALLVARPGSGLVDPRMEAGPAKEEGGGRSRDATADDDDVSCVHSDSTQRRRIFRPSTSTSSVPKGGICSRYPRIDLLEE